MKKQDRREKSRPFSLISVIRSSARPASGRRAKKSNSFGEIYEWSLNSKLSCPTLKLVQDFYR